MLNTAKTASNSYVDNFAIRYNLLHTLNAASCYKLSLRVTIKGLAMASGWQRQQAERLQILSLSLSLSVYIYIYIFSS